jgi:hypothetical protein
MLSLLGFISKNSYLNPLFGIIEQSTNSTFSELNLIFEHKLHKKPGESQHPPPQSYDFVHHSYHSYQYPFTFQSNISYKQK